MLKFQTEIPRQFQSVIDPNGPKRHGRNRVDILQVKNNYIEAHGTLPVVMRFRRRRRIHTGVCE